MNTTSAIKPGITNQIITRPEPIISGQESDPEESKSKPDKIEGAKKEYLEVERKFRNVGLGVGGVSILALIGGFFKYGSTFPAKALEVIGDCFGSISAILAPFSIIGNEIKNYFLLKEGKRENGNGIKKEKDKGIFDDWREGFYRASSIGFFPFIFEPFINPEKSGQSIFHKIATVVNIPNLLFTGYAWGIGNCKALLAWVLREKEQVHKKYYAKSEEEQKQLDKNIEGFDELYKSFKRMAVIGSIANPTLQGLRQCADSLAFITGKISAGDFFHNPFLGISRLVSLFVGIPETFAKGIDSVVRVVRERESLKLALPKFLRSDEVFKALASLENNFVKDGFLKDIRHTAEAFFHTLSPLSMFALFTPLLGERHINEEAQSRGGLPGLLNKIIGGYGKTFTAIFTGLYVALARAPQAIFQLAYFSKKLPAKFGGKIATPEDLENLKERICNSTVVKSFSNIAQKCINYLVPDWYVKNSDGTLAKNSDGSLIYNYDIENKHGYQRYEEIQASHSFDQAKGYFNGRLKEGSNLTPDDEKEIVDYCMEFVERDAKQGKHNELSPNEESKIKELIRKKIEYSINPTNPDLKLRKVELPFIGAEFLATWIFKLFDFRTRLRAIDYRSSHHNMTTAYDNDEVRISFEYELLPVVAKCTKGLGNTVNRLFGIAA